MPYNNFTLFFLCAVVGGPVSSTCSSHFLGEEEKQVIAEKSKDAITKTAKMQLFLKMQINWTSFLGEKKVMK